MKARLEKTALWLLITGILSFAACSKDPDAHSTEGGSPFLHLHPEYRVKIQEYGRTEWASVHKTEGVEACKERDFNRKTQTCRGTVKKIYMNRSQDPAKREFTLPSISFKMRIKEFFKRGKRRWEPTYPGWFKVYSAEGPFYLKLQRADDVLTCVPTIDLYAAFLDSVRNKEDCGSVLATKRYLDRLKMLGGKPPEGFNEYKLHVDLIGCRYDRSDVGPREDIVIKVGKAIPKSLFATCGLDFSHTEFTAESISKIAYSSDRDIMRLWCNYNNNLRKKEQELSLRGKIRRVKNGVTDDCGIQRVFGTGRGRAEPYFIVIPKLKSLLRAERENTFASWDTEVMEAAPEKIAKLSDLRPAMRKARMEGAAAIQFQVPSGVTNLRSVADAFIKHYGPYRTRQDTVTSNTLAILIQHLNSRYGLLPKQDTLDGSEEIVIPTNDDFVKQVAIPEGGVIFVGKLRDVPQ